MSTRQERTQEQQAAERDREQHELAASVPDSLPEARARSLDDHDNALGLTAAEHGPMIARRCNDSKSSHSRREVRSP